MGSDTVFTTPRLTVRRWRDADAADLLAVYGDAEAMVWVGDGQPITADECQQWLQVTHRNYALRGYGMFAVAFSAEPARLIGFCGIVHPGGQPEPELKYAYRRSVWGQGVATEALRGLIAHAHQVHGLHHLIATAAPENLASHRVLGKAGLRPCAPRVDDDGQVDAVFEWRAGAEPA